MMITKDEWDRRAEMAAAAKYGEKHAAWYTFKRYGAVPAAVAAIAAVLGGGTFWLYRHIRFPHPGTGPGHLPSLFWVLAAGLILATVYVFRPRAGAFVPAATVLLRAIVLSLLWLGFATYGFVVLI